MILKFCLLLSLLLLETTWAELSIHEKMYYDLKADSFASCVRRFNGTHQFGCSSDVDGNTGVLHYVLSQNDVDWVLERGQRGPYVVAMSLDMFTRDVLVQMNGSDRISGIILTHRPEVDRPKNFSLEDSCPNRYTSFLPGTIQYACDSGNPWNSYGNNLMNENWNFPIVTISDDEVLKELRGCFDKHNVPLSNQNDLWHSLCGVEMQMGMSGTTNTEVCLRRSRVFSDTHNIKQCDPIAGRNIVYSVKKISNARGEPSIKNNSLILVSTRLDAKSMFNRLVPGALSTVTSLVTLLVTAKTIAQAAKSNSSLETVNNVLFLFLDGEAYDYLGSTRLIYDLKNGSFPKSTAPIFVNQLKFMLELSQISTSDELNVHYFKKEPVILDFLRLLSRGATKFGVNATFETDLKAAPLGPMSLLNFQNSLKNNLSLPTALLTTTNASVNQNRFYHSMFDDEKNLAYKFYNKSNIPNDTVQITIQKTALALADSLLSEMYGEEGNTFDLAVDEHLVDELLYCYLIDPNCSLFSTLSGYMDSSRPNFFVGVKDHKRYLVTVSGLLLANFTGTTTNLTREECEQKMNQIWEPGTSDNVNYFWIIKNADQENSGFCTQHLVNFTSALSPAFDIPDYDWTSGQYPSWSESVWIKLGMRVFLQPAPHYEKLVFFTGMIVLLVSFVAVLFLRKHISSLVSNIIPETMVEQTNGSNVFGS